MTTRQNFEETHKLDHAGELRGGGNFHGNRHPTIGRYSCRVRKWRGTACIRWLSPRITWIIVQYFVGKTIIYVLVSRPTQCTMSIAFTAGRPLSRRSERSVYRSRCYSLGCFWSVPGLSRTKNGPHKILLYYWSSWTQETELLYALQQKSTLVITPHVPVLLANESEDTVLGTFYGRKWTITLNLRAYSKNDHGDWKETWECPWKHANTSYTTQLSAVSLYVAMSQTDSIGPSVPKMETKLSVKQALP